jgi:hypothetical protein
MKWVAGIGVFSSVLYGVYLGIRREHDAIFYPFSGFLVGLMIFWLFRAVYRANHKSKPGLLSSDQGVGIALFGVSCVVAVLYFGMAGFGAYVGRYGSLPVFLAVMAFVSLVIGETIRRAYRPKPSN